MTQQTQFGGPWTQQKLEVLSRYLKEYRTIFAKNERARYFRTSYVDAFAGTGQIPRPSLDGTFETLLPELVEAEEEFKKGSVRRAFEIEPPFHHYHLIEKDNGKCEELYALREEFPERNVAIVNDDANAALLDWCHKISRRDRAVVFLDPFGASINWEVIEALGATDAVDLWILFPYSAINRMLTRDRKPDASWCEKLTWIFGTDEWESKFYSTPQVVPGLFPDQEFESTQKIADQSLIVDFYLNRLRSVFPKVPEPGLLFNSRNLLFALIFATRSEPGLKIAKHLLSKIVR